MRKAAKISHNLNEIALLSVGLTEEDNAALSGILSGCPVSPFSGFHWRLEASHSPADALPLLEQRQNLIVICERDLAVGSWKELLDPLPPAGDSPCVIVASRLADERLWAEALNLGAYDVLSKPFDASEVLRVLGSAWLHNTYRGGKTIVRRLPATTARALPPYSVA